MLRVFALAASSSGALNIVWYGGRQVCMQEEKQLSGTYKIKESLWGRFFTSHVITSCSSYFYFLCSVICTGLTHPVAVSSAQMVLHDPLMLCTIWVNYGSETLWELPLPKVCLYLQTSNCCLYASFTAAQHKNFHPCSPRGRSLTLWKYC